MFTFTSQHFSECTQFFLSTPIKTRSAQRRNNSKIRAGSYIIQKKVFSFRKTKEMCEKIKAHSGFIIN